MSEEEKIPVARTPLETSLGFRIDVRPDGEAGSVIWFTTGDRRSGVRPATGVEIRMWKMLCVLVPEDDPSYFDMVVNEDRI